MTVALGPKGNNLILGGRLNQVSAEEAYTVSRLSCLLATLISSTALDNSRFRGRRGIRLSK